MIRRSGLRRSARILPPLAPPFFPPRRPRRTAAGSFRFFIRLETQIRGRAWVQHFCVVRQYRNNLDVRSRFCGPPPRNHKLRSSLRNDGQPEHIEPVFPGKWPESYLEGYQSSESNTHARGRALNRRGVAGP